jgi:hypothetical protein
MDIREVRREVAPYFKDGVDAHHVLKTKGVWHSAVHKPHVEVSVDSRFGYFLKTKGMIGALNTEK